MQSHLYRYEIHTSSYISCSFSRGKAYLELNTLIAQKKYSTLFILVDENTFEHCYSKFIPNLDTDKTIEVIEIESGEINKNIETCVGVWNAITELGGDRKSLLITLGGVSSQI